MHWLYLNSEEAPEFLESISSIQQSNNYAVFDKVFAGQKIKFYYDTREWETVPYVEDQKEFIFVCGWFILGTNKNDIYGLLKSIREIGLSKVLNSISIGVFVGGYFDGESLVMFNDAFSLSHHFVSISGGHLKIAPTIESLIEKEDLPDDNRSDFLTKFRYLLGNDTLFPSVQRFPPGTILYEQNAQFVPYLKFFTRKPIHPEEVPEVINNLCGYWTSGSRSLALSSGFDSRLIYSQAEFGFVYTWGPENSADRKVAEKLFKEKGDPDSNYLGFRFHRNSVSVPYQVINESLVFGAKLPANINLILNYGYAADNADKAYVSFDGYLGDVLQQGSYLKGKGVLYETLLLFPKFFSLLKPDSVGLLNVRYKGFFDYANGKYQEFLDFYDLKDSAESFNLFEILYGRGTRFIINGGLVLNGVYNVVVPVFMHREIFDSLAQCRSIDLLSRKIMKRIWRDIPFNFKVLRSEHFYNLYTPNWLIPFIAFFGKVATHSIPYFYNYTKERPVSKRR